MEILIQTGQQSSAHLGAGEYHTPNLLKLIGGTNNLIREVSRVCFELDPSVPPEWMIKRVQFFVYDLNSLVPQDVSPREKLDALNTYFFKTKGFYAVTEMGPVATDPLQYYALNSVLAQRKGAPMVLALIYVYLAEKLGLQLEFVDLHPTSFLKFVTGGSSQFIDISRHGKILDSHELLESIHQRVEQSRVCPTDLLETISFERFMIEYMSELKNSFRLRHDLQALLSIQNFLIQYQPSNLQLLGERALLFRRLGQFKNALADLKRFFAFVERDKCPPEWTRLYEELTQLS